MSLRKFIIALAAPFIAQSALAEDHLEPEDSIFTRWYDEEFDRYEAIVVSKLKEAFGHGNVARAIVIPSFEPEYAVAINEQGGQFTLLYLKPETHLWLYEVLRDYERGLITSTDRDGNDNTAKNIEDLRGLLRVPLDKVPLERCETSLDAQTGIQLLVLWKTALRQTQHPVKAKLGFDGVTYHFSGAFEANNLAGKIWSPDRNSPMGKLVSIVTLLRETCLSKDGGGIDDIRLRAKALCSEIGCGE